MGGHGSEATGGRGSEATGGHGSEAAGGHGEARGGHGEAAGGHGQSPRVSRKNPPTLSLLGENPLQLTLFGECLIEWKVNIQLIAIFFQLYFFVIRPLALL